MAVLTDPPGGAKFQTPGFVPMVVEISIRGDRTYDIYSRLLHQPLGGFEGQATDIGIHAREILQVRRRFEEILAKHTGQSEQRIQTDTERDYFMSARDAVDYGVINDVLEHRESLPKN